MRTKSLRIALFHFTNVCISHALHIKLFFKVCRLGLKDLEQTLKITKTVYEVLVSLIRYMLRFNDF